VVVQATSPYHAKESYLCIKRTLEMAGWNTLPYHDNVPSFGDWGWLIASRHLSTQALQDDLQEVKFQVGTRYLSEEVFQSSLVFGKGALTAKNSGINTLMEPVLLRYYQDESWLVE
jgi:spermidine synthase